MTPDYDVTTFETWRLKAEEDFRALRPFLLNTEVRRPLSVFFASKWLRNI
jgi:hypothetical protein